MKSGEVVKGCEGIKIEKRVLEKALDRLGWSVNRSCVDLKLNRVGKIDTIGK